MQFKYTKILKPSLRTLPMFPNSCDAEETESFG